MSDEEKPGEGFMERAAEIVMTWLDVTPIALALEAEYQRGVSHGREQVAATAEQLAAEYQRGQDDYRDGLLKELDSRRTKPKEPPAKSIEETGVKGTSEPEKRTGEPPADKEAAFEEDRLPGQLGEVTEKAVFPLKPVMSTKAPKNSSRPSGIPSNPAMAIAAITALGPSSGTAIRNWCRNKYWPEMPDGWNGTLYEMASARKLRRVGINFDLPLLPVGAAKPEQHVLPKEPVRMPAPAVNPTDGPRHVVTPGAKLGPPARGGPMAFKHQDKTALLHHREFAIAQCLRAAMGRGHVDTQFLAQKALGIDKRNAIDNESLLRDLVSIMNPKLATIGLNIEFHKGFGFLMKELS